MCIDIDPANLLSNLLKITKIIIWAEAQMTYQHANLLSNLFKITKIIIWAEAQMTHQHHVEPNYSHPICSFSSC